MSLFSVRLCSFGVILLFVSLLGLIAQNLPPNNGSELKEGIPGKDVIYITTKQELVDIMLDLAKVTSEDYVIDLGSGDGRTVIAAAKRGAHALGIEYNPDLVEYSKLNAAREGVSKIVKFIRADIFESNLSKATVVTMYLLPDLNLRIRPTLLELKPGTRIVSNTFTMLDWIPDESVSLKDDCVIWCTAHLWIIPAKVEGTWKLVQGELILKQDFQMISGILITKNDSISISGGRLRGDEITFNINEKRYTGQVKTNSIKGEVSDDRGSSGWIATRTNKISILSLFYDKIKNDIRARFIVLLSIILLITAVSFFAFFRSQRIKKNSLTDN